MVEAGGKLWDSPIRVLTPEERVERIAGEKPENNESMSRKSKIEDQGREVEI